MNLNRETEMKFEPIYIEAHNHLREADTNRNQIINYYLIAVGAYITIHFPQCWQIMIGLIITYLIVLNLSAAKSLFGDYNNKEYKIPFPSATWLLEGVAKSDQIFSYIDSNKKQKIH